jgi:hypothetical protein
MSRVADAVSFLRRRKGWLALLIALLLICIYGLVYLAIQKSDATKVVQTYVSESAQVFCHGSHPSKVSLLPFPMTMKVSGSYGTATLSYRVICQDASAKTLRVNLQKSGDVWMLTSCSVDKATLSSCGNAL